MRPPWRSTPSLGEEREQVVLDGPVRVAEVVAVAQRERVAAVVGEEREPPVELGQLVEVEDVEADPVAEDVLLRLCAGAWISVPV